VHIICNYATLADGRMRAVKQNPILLKELIFPILCSTKQIFSWFQPFANTKEINVFK
jgi:hypothetical protein